MTQALHKYGSSSDRTLRASLVNAPEIFRSLRICNSVAHEAAGPSEHSNPSGSWTMR
nr:hypothetical protein [Mesorhizobium caraganae]